MFKRIFVVLLCVFTCQSIVNSKEIAFLNLEKVADGSTAFKKAKDMLDKRKQTVQKKLDNKQTEILNKKKDIESKSSVLSKDTLQKKIESFQAEVLAFQEEVKKEDEKLQKDSMNVLKQLNDKVVEIVSKMVKEKSFTDKYSYVANASLFIFYDKENDITNEVLKRLNKEKLDLTKAISK